MERIRKVAASGKGCKIMIGDREVISNAEWSFEGVAMMTWKQWIWFKIKRICHTELNPILHTGNTVGAGQISGGSERH
jgi:hypothetical protein